MFFFIGECERAAKTNKVDNFIHLHTKPCKEIVLGGNTKKKAFN